MEFIKFRSLTNAYNQKFVDICQEQGIRDWVVTEKVHGANMGLYCDGRTVKPASRSQFVGLDFFNCERTVTQKLPAVYAVYCHLNSVKYGLSYIIVYGEYFGGLFQGATQDTHAKKVQKGIEYCPNNDFLAFNCLQVFEDGTQEWVSTVELQEILEVENKSMVLKTVPILSYGNLAGCLCYSNKEQSIIPGFYGLKATGDNVSEGVVIMPRNGEDYTRPTGAEPLFLGLKNKNDLWSEKGSAPKVPTLTPEELKPFLEELGVYVTENRFNNVMSKEGEADPKQFGRYLGLFLEDIYGDYGADGGKLPTEQKDRKVLSKELAKLCRVHVLQFIQG